MHHKSLKNIFIFGLTLLSFGFLSAQFVVPSGIDNALQIIQRVLITTTGTSTGDVVMDMNTGDNNIYLNPNFLSTTGAYSGNLFLTLDADGYISFASGAIGATGATGETGPMGPQGIQGPPGDDGIDGQDGLGVDNAFLSGNDLIVTLSDMTEINVGSVVGADGTDGQDGVDGINGQDGAAGVGIDAITDNQDGTFTITLTNNDTTTINIPGGPSGDHDWYTVGTTDAPSDINDDIYSLGNVAIGTGQPFTNSFGSPALSVSGSYIGLGYFVQQFTSPFFNDTSGSITLGDAGDGSNVNMAVDSLDGNAGITVFAHNADNRSDINLSALNNTTDDQTFIRIEDNQIFMRSENQSLADNTDFIINKDFGLFVGPLGIGASSLFTPDNVLDINKDSLGDPNTLGLRFSNAVGTSHSGRLVGLNIDGDLLPLIDINTLGGGGGVISPWEYHNSSSPTTAGVQLAGWSTAAGEYSLAGGLGNDAWGILSVVVGGSGNAAGFASAIVGGVNNINNGTAGFIGGGGDNIIHDGEPNVIVGGADNIITGNTSFSFIGGGLRNELYGNYGFIGGGLENIAVETGDIIIGGLQNAILGGFFSPDFPLVGLNLIGGGANNTIQTGAVNTIAGGLSNSIAIGGLSFIGGGVDNTITGNVSMIGGGSGNSSSGNNNVIAGGDGNRIQGDQVSIVGGRDNEAQGQQVFLGGGLENSTDGDHSVVVGGRGNINTGMGGFIGGGMNNMINEGYFSYTIGGNYSSIVGGTEHILTGTMSSILGGGSHRLYGPTSSILGGYENALDGISSSIRGGEGNIMHHGESSILGGMNNQLNGNQSVLVGGFDNFLAGSWSSLLGGRQNNLSGTDSVIVGGLNNDITGDSSFIGGGINNYTSLGESSVIVGGRNNLATTSYIFVGGGDNNHGLAMHSSIAGGINNITLGVGAAIVGGSGNETRDSYAFVGGGENNIANGEYASILGGINNSSIGFAATVIGGSNNTTSANYSIAGGQDTSASHENTFVWGDGSTTTSSTSPGQVVMRASGGYNLFSSNASMGVSLAPGASSWGSISDRDAKENITTIDKKDILGRFMQLPLFAWNYKGDPEQILHYGPMAQDFNEIFAHGNKDLTLSTQEIDGVMFVALQALGEKVQEQDQRISELEQLVQSLLDK